MAAFQQIMRRPSEDEVALSREQNRTMAEYFKVNVQPPCDDLECVRSKKKMETYALCAKCQGYVQNYFALGIIPRTTRMKSVRGPAAVVAELAISAKLWRAHNCAPG